MKNEVFAAAQAEFDRIIAENDELRARIAELEELDNSAWATLHELLDCGHPRACWQDRNYPESEQNYNPDKFSGDKPTDYLCVACESQKRLEKEIKRLHRLNGFYEELMKRKSADIASLKAELARHASGTIPG